jgi:DNA-binding GntR family transcriptional regulator
MRALRRSVRAGDDDWEAAIVAAFHALDLQVRRLKREGDAADASALEARHHDFHRALIARCGSNRLIELADQLHAETERYRIPTLTGRSKQPTARDVPEEHRQVMEAALARRPEDAAELLAQHYRRTALAVEAG